MNEGFVISINMFSFLWALNASSVLDRVVMLPPPVIYQHISFLWTVITLNVGSQHWRSQFFIHTVFIQPSGPWPSTDDRRSWRMNHQATSCPHRPIQQSNASHPLLSARFSWWRRDTAEGDDGVDAAFYRRAWIFGLDSLMFMLTYHHCYQQSMCASVQADLGGLLEEHECVWLCTWMYHLWARVCV